MQKSSQFKTIPYLSLCNKYNIHHFKLTFKLDVPYFFINLQKQYYGIPFLPKSFIFPQNLHFFDFLILSVLDLYDINLLGYHIWFQNLLLKVFWTFIVRVSIVMVDIDLEQWIKSMVMQSIKGSRQESYYETICQGNEFI